MPLDPRPWVQEAACAGTDQEMWWPEVMRGVEARAAERTALAICDTCPVRAACLKWAIEHEPRGIWGGTTSRQRRLLRQALGRVVDPIEQHD